MTDCFLRYHVNEAAKEGKVGLMIWASDRIADFFSDFIGPGDKDYEFALAQVSKNEEATVSVQWTEMTMPGFIAVPVQKLKDSTEYFNHVMEVIRERHYDGPITSIPS